MLMRASVALSFLFCWLGSAVAYDPLPRWGQAHALVNDVLFVHGGKTDEYNAIGYNSAPTNDDLLYLSLSNSFDPSSPSWDYVGGSFNSCTTQGPSVAWHTLSAYGTSHVLLFGGIPEPASPISVSGSDSAALLDVYNRIAPSWKCQDQSWANEPMRRYHHSSASLYGKIYIIGGAKVDGSGLGFSEHYVFDPTVPEFTQLTTANAPPDIYGHVSVLLEDGRLLVFGGYTASSSKLNVFSDIWVLDLTKTDADWYMATVATDSLPSPRRAFAATAIGNGKVLIHGGSDASLQTSLSDGWILDTTRDPWTWTKDDALSQLGPRRDHFAVHYGSNVIFGFGYASNGPAGAGLSVYDTSSGSFTSSYQPPPTPTFIVTLPGPTYTTSIAGSGVVTITSTPTGTVGSGASPTGSNESGDSSATGTNDHNSSGASVTSSGSHPGSTGGGNSGHDNGNGNDDGQIQDGGKSKDHVAAITLGTIFGLLGLLVGAGVTHYYLQKRRERRERFFLLGGDETDDDMHSLESGALLVAGAGHQHPPMAGTMPRHGLLSDIAGMVGLGTAMTNHTERRRDMLGDEDTSQYELGYNPYYDVPRRQGSASTGTSTGRRRERPTFQNFMQGSLASLRSVGGAMLGMSTKTSRSREPSGKSEHWDEKDPFGDQTALMHSEGPTPKAERPRGGRQESSASSRWSYVDPFSDPHYAITDQDEPYSPYADSPIRPTIQTIMPSAIAAATALSPVSEQPSSYHGSSDPTASVISHDLSSQSHGTPHSNELRSSLSHEMRSSQSHASSPRSPNLRPSSIIDANPIPSSPLTRSESWWARFAGKTFLDRRSSDASRPAGSTVPFRDPNPPPRLVAIEERSPESNTSPVSPISPAHRRSLIYALTSHGRSASSLRTSRTANSELIERLGGSLEVVQRDRSAGDSTFSSRQPSTTSTGSVKHTSPEIPSVPWKFAPRPLSVVISSGSHDTEPSEHVMVETPLETEETLFERPEPALASRERTPSPPAPALIASTSPTRRSPGGSAVAARVKAFEQHAEASRSPASPPSAGERSTRKIEHRTAKSPRPSVNYGLAQRPSLFVANPDSRSPENFL